MPRGVVRSWNTAERSSVNMETAVLNAAFLGRCPARFSASAIWGYVRSSERYIPS